MLMASLLLLLAAPSGAEPEASAREAAARLRAAADAHPDDPDLAWAAALALARAGDPAGIERLAAFEARWPELRPEASFELGRALAAAGRDAEALGAFERALAREPGSGSVELHRALVLRRLGRHDEAEAALERAAQLEPALAPEVLLLRGVARARQGDPLEGRRLLGEAVALDGDGEAARRARALLGAAPPPGRRYSLMAQSGIEYDSNVTLDSGLPIVGTGSNRQDLVSTFAAGGLVRALQSERASLTLGYRFDGTLHFDLSDYDLENHLVIASGMLRVASRATARLDTLLDYARLDDDGYAWTYALRPNVFVGLSERLGALRLHGEIGRRSYLEQPTLSSLDRDGWIWAVGLEQSAPVPGWPGARATLGGRFSQLGTDADPDLLGFEGAYDHSRWEGATAIEAPLPGRIRARAALGLGWERYEHDNVLDFLTDGGVGTLEPEARRDWVTDASITLVRPLHRLLDLEAGWRFTHRDSNVDLYGYDRHIVGLVFRVHVD
jgi:tetratricopeptide (TPR) repeat protein